MSCAQRQALIEIEAFDALAPALPLQVDLSALANSTACSLQGPSVRRAFCVSQLRQMN